MVQPLKNAVVGLVAFAAGCDFVEPSAPSQTSLRTRLFRALRRGPVAAKPR